MLRFLVALKLWLTTTTLFGMTLFTESWESAPLPQGGNVSLPSASLPIWIEEPFEQDAIVKRPGLAGQGTSWNQTEPFTSPADSNQMLALRHGVSNLDNGVYAVLPVQLAPNMVYSLSAAIGFDATDSSAGAWSIQLWADSNGNNALDRSLGDTFLGQVFTQETIGGIGVDPARGGWHRNHITYDSSSQAEVLGQNIIAFLNNYVIGSVSSATSYFDNLQLEAISASTLEPSSNRQIEAPSTFLKPVTPADTAHLELVQNAKRIELASGLGFTVREGDWLRITAVGDFKFTQDLPPSDLGPYGNGTLRSAVGVFSSNSQLRSETDTVRVPGAADVSEGNYAEYASDPGNDIPEDFVIPSETDAPLGTLVRVPAGATHLFLAAADTQWSDNSDQDSDFGVNVTRIYAGRFLGDYNFDGFVDTADYTIWRDARGQAGIDLAGDGNLDGVVNQADYLIWEEHFGESVSSSSHEIIANTIVPEPSASGIVLCCVLMSAGWCRRPLIAR